MRLGNPFPSSHEPILIEKNVIDHIYSHMLDVFPEEGSGMLGGTGNRITLFIPVRNGATPSNRETTFFWKPEDFLEGLHHLEKEGAEWLGVVHSHPSSAAIPSVTDRKNWHYHQLSYWILSLKEKEKPVLRMYRFCDGGFDEQGYHVTK